MKKLLLALALFVTGGAVQAGPISSGGGKVVVCRDSQNKISSVELLDLWEARVIFGRHVQISTASVQSQANHLVDELKDSILTDGVLHAPNGDFALVGPDGFKTDLEWEVNELLTDQGRSVHWISGGNLQPTNDSFETVTPSDCKIEQIVRYNESYSGADILINKDLYQVMDSTNQAALLAHEAYYSRLRVYGEKSSIRVRRAIGLVASGYHFENPSLALPTKKPHYRCSSGPLLALGPDIIHIYEMPPPPPELLGPSEQNMKSYIVFPDVIAGRKMIGYKSSDNWRLNILAPDIARLFSGIPFGYTTSTQVGFDYSFSITLSHDDKGSLVASVTMESAPDEAAPVIVKNMPCVLN